MDSPKTRRVTWEDNMALASPAGRPPSHAQYEFRTVRFDRSTSRTDARRLLTDEAEYGRWELHRSVVYAGGERRVELRRRIIRVRSTL
jgi:hypothetical protein